MSNDESKDSEIDVKKEDETTDETAEDDSSSAETKKDDSDVGDDAEVKVESSSDEKEKESEEESEEEKKKREEELKKKYADWPLRNIKDPHDNDVMYGRGGGTNHHPGNKRYRKWVEDRKLEYVNSKRLDKPLVALEIIRKWRAQLPPGRFLKLDEKTGLWNDVGDKKAREKTSQALREKAPLIRKQQEEEERGEAGEDGTKETKSTRFAEGTKKESGQVKKAVLARDHSLGREYIQAGESVSLEGFSWQDPFKTSKKPTHPAAPPPAPHAAYPPGRNSSHGSLGMAPPHHTSVGAPPPPDYWGRVPSDDRQRQFSNSRYESWGPYPYPPPPPHAMLGATHQRSGSWTHPLPPPSPHAPGHQRSGSWGSGREHSLSNFPLRNASVSHPADWRTFDSNRSSSGYWGESIPPPPTPPPGPYGGGPQMSNGSMGPFRQPASPANSGSTTSPKPPYSVDMDIAKSWSGEKGRKSWSGEQPYPYEYDGQPKAVPGADKSPIRDGASSNMPRPNIVKRDTSHQNETDETKHSVKRAALNRDNSLASNMLKNQYMPEHYTFDSEMKKLSLDPGSVEKSRPKPKPLGEDGRMSTVEAIEALAMDMTPKPETLSEGNRLSTVEALEMAVNLDMAVKPQSLQETNRVSTIEALNIALDDDPSESFKFAPLKEESPKAGMPKPSAITPDNRLTTQDFLEIVNTPLVEEALSKSEKVSDDEPLSLNQEKLAEEWLTQT